MERRANKVPLIAIADSPEAHCENFLDGLMITREEIYNAQSASVDEIVEANIALKPSTVARIESEASAK